MLPSNSAPEFVSSNPGSYDEKNFSPPFAAVSDIQEEPLPQTDPYVLQDTLVGVKEVQVLPG